VDNLVIKFIIIKDFNELKFINFVTLLDIMERYFRCKVIVVMILAIIIKEFDSFTQEIGKSIIMLIIIIKAIIITIKTIAMFIINSLIIIEPATFIS